MSMIPKGGDAIWGGLDWSPEETDKCSKKPKNNVSNIAGQNGNENSVKMKKVKYGRIISFGKDVAEAPSSKIKRVDFRVIFNLKFIIYCYYHFSHVIYKKSNICLSISPSKIVIWDYDMT